MLPQGPNKILRLEVFQRPHPTYRCCNIEIPLDDPLALGHIRDHIHSHRLGTPGTASECWGCLKMAAAHIVEILEMRDATPRPE